MVERLIREAKRYPMLTPVREREIATAWRDRGDRAALDALVGSHLRLVVKIARGFAGYRLPLGDLVAEGNIGLLHAAEKFEPERGFRFSTYAMWWIRAAIQQYVLRSWSLVRVGTTAAQKRLFFNLRRAQARLEAFHQNDLAPEDVRAIAHDLDVPEDDVVDMHRRLAGRDSSLNAIASEDTENELLNLLPDERPNQEAVIGEIEERRHHRAFLDAALKQLSSRERAIVVARKLKETPVTLEELSSRFAVSPERIRQIEMHAVEKMARSVANTVGPRAIPAAA